MLPKQSFSNPFGLQSVKQADQKTSTLNDLKQELIQRNETFKKSKEDLFLHCSGIISKLKSLTEQAAISPEIICSMFFKFNRQLFSGIENLVSRTPISNNLPVNQRIAMKSLLKDSNSIIRPTDKNLGPC